MKYILVTMFMLIVTCHAMSYGKVFHTLVPIKTSSNRCVVKDISELAEFADLIIDVDNRRRILELREGINQAKAKTLHISDYVWTYLNFKFQSLKLYEYF